VIMQNAPAIADLPDHPAERLVRQLREAGDKRTVQLPLTVARSQDVATLVSVNFGRIVAGHVELEVEAPPGVRLDLFYQESADYDAVAGPVASAPRSSASYITRGFADNYKAVDINGLRQIFLMIPPGAGEVTVRDIAVSEYHYPFTGGAAFSLQRPGTGPALSGRDPHHADELLRCVHRLPDAGAAGLGRRWGGAPDGALRRQRGLATGP
jgi:alpha-L-rhamnosidase